MILLRTIWRLMHAEGQKRRPTHTPRLLLRGAIESTPCPVLQRQISPPTSFSSTRVGCKRLPDSRPMLLPRGFPSSTTTNGTLWGLPEPQPDRPLCSALAANLPPRINRPLHKPGLGERFASFLESKRV